MENRIQVTKVVLSGIECWSGSKVEKKTVGEADAWAYQHGQTHGHAKARMTVVFENGEEFHFGQDYGSLEATVISELWRWRRNINTDTMPRWFAIYGDLKDEKWAEAKVSWTNIFNQYDFGVEGL